MNKIVYKEIPLDQIKVSDKYSFKVLDNDIFSKLQEGIIKFGQLKNIVVSLDAETNAYNIIDGYYVYLILRGLNYESAMCSIVDLKTENDLHLLSLSLNVYLNKDIIRLAEKYKLMLEAYTPEYICSFLPIEHEEIRLYPALLGYDFEKYDNALGVLYKENFNNTFF